MPNKERKSLHEDVYKSLQQKIISGHLKPLTRIVESKFAKELKVSRTPLREALFQLEQEGFVCSEVNKGFIVQPLSTREIREVYPVLWTLESQALELCGGLAFTDTKKLSEINESFRRAKGNSVNALKADAIWHQTLISSCPNKFLLKMIEKMRSLIRRYEYVYMLDTVLISDSVSQHEQIISALRKHNLAAAKDALETHWRVSFENLLLCIGEP